jgi:antirestriction protein
MYHYGTWDEGNPFTCVYKNKVTVEIRRGRDVTPSCQDCKDEYEMNCME